MTDYTKATGNAGTMLIRDLGTTVDFWLKSSSGSFNAALPWRYTANGATTAMKYFNFVNAAGTYQKLGSVSVTTSQTVTFYIGDTGTAGLGGPTTFSVALSRSTVPSGVTIASATIYNTSMALDANWTSSGGLAILQVQFGYGLSTTGLTSYKDGSISTGAVALTGLTPKTTYYIWARVRNANGWSAWSPRRTYLTQDVPSAPSTPILSAKTQTSFTATTTPGANNGSAILETRIGYSTSSAGPTTYISGTSVSVTGLSPGSTYYVWAQSRNAYGWGPLSAYSTSKTAAGAIVWYRVNGVLVRKEAVPYVRYNGVWRPAKPFGRIASLWRSTY